MSPATCLLSHVLSASMAMTAPGAREAASLPPEAAAHSERGMALYERGELEAAITELERAYASMSDARRFDVGRDIVVASMRSALLDLYEQTGDARHLCRARDLLVRHLEALLDAFGEDTTIEDVPGTRWHLGQIRARLAEHGRGSREPSDPCAIAPPSPPPPVRRVVSAPPPAPVRSEQPTGRAWKLAGGITLAAGATLLGAMTYSLVTRRASLNAVREFDALASARGHATDAELAAIAALRQADDRHRALALAAGITGGVLLVTGVAALIVARIRARDPRPLGAPTSRPQIGLALHIAF